MIIPLTIPVYGDIAWRGKCPTEDAEHVTFVNAVKKTRWANLLIHPKNEGKRTASQAQWDKARGMQRGASDFIIAIGFPFICEMKRKDHTKSTLQSGQLEFLELAQDNGAWCCIALGWEAAWQALQEWQSHVGA